MKCRDAHEMMNSYFDNNIDPMKDKLLAEHVNSCRKCRAELDFLSKYRGVLKSVKPVPPPDNFISELHRRIKLEEEKSLVKKITGRIITFRSSLNFPLEAAGVLAVAVVVLFLYRPFFSGKIHDTTPEYGVELPVIETPVKKDKHAIAERVERGRELKNTYVEKREAPSGREIVKDKITDDISTDISPSTKAAGDYDKAESNVMRKSRSVESEKRLMQSEEKAGVAGGMDSGEIAAPVKETIQRPVSEAERVFREYNVLIVRKDLSGGGRLYYRIKVQAVKRELLIKKLKEDYLIEEKIIKIDKSFYETELFLEKKKN